MPTRTQDAFKNLSQQGRLVPEKGQAVDRTRGRGRPRPILDGALGRTNRAISKLDEQAGTCTNIEKGVQFEYHRSDKIYRCPADPTRATNGLVVVPATRSYMLNGWLNGPDIVINHPRFRTTYGSLRDPARVFAFIDAKTCDSGSFWIRLVEWEKDEWINSPGDWHNRGCNLTFADGHVEYHRWRAPKSSNIDDPAEPPDDLADLRWLQDLIPKE